MYSQFKGIMYRNLLLFRRILIPMMVLTSVMTYFYLEETKLNPKVVLGIFSVMMANQVVPFFVYSMVDDRASKFKSTFKIMGLRTLPYVFGQFMSFFVFSFVSFGLFCLSMFLFCKSRYPMVLDSYFYSLIAMMMMMAPLISIFSMALSFLFGSFRSSKDYSVIVAFGLIVITVSSLASGKFEFLRWVIPFFPTIRSLMYTAFGQSIPADYNVYSELIPMAAQTLAYGLLAIYLENLYPGDEDLGKKALFFLEKEDGAREVQEDLRIIDQEEGLTSTGDLIARNVTKKFGNFVALDKVNLSLKKGRTCCMLGQNGAGKSTFISILTGMLKEDEGSVRFGGRDFKKQIRDGKVTIGICPAYEYIFENISLRSHFAIGAMLKGIDSPFQKADQMIEFLDVLEFKDRLGRELSGGTKRKLTLGMALIGQSSILFLDEPTSALDPVSRQEIWGLLERAKASNPELLCLLTTHHLEEAEKLADDVAILANGEVKFTGPVNSMKKEFGFAYKIEVFPDSKNSDPKEEDISRIHEVLRESVHADFVFRTQDKIEARIPFSQIGSITQILKSVRESLPQGFDIVINSNTLEQAYIDITSGGHSGRQAFDRNFVKSAIERLYTRESPSSARKLLLLVKIKFLHLRSDFVELIKIVFSYLLLAFLVNFVLRFKQRDGLTLSPLGDSDDKFLLMISLASVVFFEMMVANWSPKNVIYEKAFELKPLFFINGVSPLRYYLSKILADLLVIIPGFLLLFVVFEASIVEAFRWEMRAAFLVTFFWRLSMMSYSYVLSLPFKELNHFYRFYPLAYFALPMVIWGISGLTSTKFLFFFNDLTSIMYFISEIGPSQQLEKAILVFSAQSIFFFLFLISLESYLLSYNFKNKNVEQLDDPVRQPPLEMQQSVDRAAERAADPENTLHAIRLKKRYGNVSAVKGVSFGVKPKSSFGLVGANGAGKTTTFGMLLGRVTKSSGIINFLGIEPSYLSNPFIEKKIAACFQTNALWEDMTSERHIDFFCEFLGARPGVARELARYLEFEQNLYKSPSQLSSGNKRKLCMIIALLSNPSFMFFDEATTGVDLPIRLKLKQIFDSLSQINQTASIHTTHFLKDIEIFCDTIGIMEKGQFYCVQRVNNLKSEFGGYFVHFIPADGVSHQEIEQTVSGFGEIKKRTELNDNAVLLVVRNVKDHIELFQNLVELERSNKLKSFMFNQLSVEDIFIDIMGHRPDEELQ